MKNKISAIVVGVLVMVALNGCSTFAAKTYTINHGDGTTSELSRGEYVEWLMLHGQRDEAMMMLKYGTWYR